MEARAVLKQIGVPATKVRQLIDLIRGKPVEEALTILRFSPRPVAKLVEKTSVSYTHLTLPTIYSV